MELQDTKKQNQFKKIAVVADHRGEEYIKFVIKALDEVGIAHVVPEYEKSEINDYPDMVVAANKLLQAHVVDGMILLCGTGVGMSIAANKCKNVRGVLAFNETIAAFGRLHEDCNALAMCSKYSDEKLGLEVRMCKRKMQRIVKTFVTTPFAGGRHLRRIDKLNNIK